MRNRSFRLFVPTILAAMATLSCSKSDSVDTTKMATPPAPPSAQMVDLHPAWTPFRAKSVMFHDRQRLSGSWNGYGDLISLKMNPDTNTLTWATYANGQSRLVAWVVVEDSAGGEDPKWRPGLSCIYVRGKVKVGAPVGLHQLQSVVTYRGTRSVCEAQPDLSVARVDTLYGTRSAGNVPHAVRLDFDNSMHPVVGVQCVKDYLEFPATIFI